MRHATWDENRIACLTKPIGASCAGVAGQLPLAWWHDAVRENRV